MPSPKKRNVCLLLAVVAIVNFSSAIGQTNAKMNEVNKHLGETVVVCGTIISIKHLENVKDKPTLINLANVTQHLDVVIGTDNESFSNLTADTLQYKDACVTGKIYYFKGTEHTYLKAENIKLKQSEIVASTTFKEKEPQQISTPELLSATEKSNVRRKIILYKNKPDPQQSALLIKYIKLGKIISFSQTKDKKTYTVLLKEYKKS